MRLTDLAPHWVTFANPGDGVRFYYGVSFLCPHCEHAACPTCGAQRGKRMAVSFWPPVDPDNLLASGMTEIPHDGFHKRISGEDFDRLTLEPSIGFEGHWHGRITNGQIV